MAHELKRIKIRYRLPELSTVAGQLYINSLVLSFHPEVGWPLQPDSHTEYILGYLNLNYTSEVHQQWIELDGIGIPKPKFELNWVEID